MNMLKIMSIRVRINKFFMLICNFRKDNVENNVDQRIEVGRMLVKLISYWGLGNKIGT